MNYCCSKWSLVHKGSHMDAHRVTNGCTLYHTPTKQARHTDYSMLWPVLNGLICFAKPVFFPRRTHIAALLQKLVVTLTQITDQERYSAASTPVGSLQ